MKMEMTRRGPRTQRGVSLVVGMVMLIMVTMLVIGAFKLGKGSLEIVGNLQQRNAVTQAANATIQEVISSSAFTVNPGNVFTIPCAGANTRCFDTNGSGTDDIVVTLTPAPSCIQAQPILNNQIDFNDAKQRLCLIEAQQGTAGIEGVPANQSLCSNSLWSISARAVDSTTQATTVVTEGVAVRVATAVIDTACP